MVLSLVLFSGPAAGSGCQGGEADGVAEGCVDGQGEARAAPAFAEFQHVAREQRDYNLAGAAVADIENGIARAGSPNERFVYICHPIIYHSRFWRIAETGPFAGHSPGMKIKFDTLSALLAERRFTARFCRRRRGGASVKVRPHEFART